MLELASDPQLARQQLNGLIFYLTTFSSIDGELHPAELDFIHETLRRLVEHRVESKGLGNDPALRAELVESVTAELEEVFDAALGEVTRLLGEAVAEAERDGGYVTSTLKLRCFEVFQGLEPEMQEALLAAADELVMADGEAHPAEIELRRELTALLRSPVDAPFAPPAYERRVEVHAHDGWTHETLVHPTLDQLETHYSGDEATRLGQIGADRSLVQATLDLLEQQRAVGRGRLAGARVVDDLPPGRPFLDEHVYVLPPSTGRSYDVTVVGDLHGCYSCLKAALAQSRFLEKVAAYREDPRGRPDPHLVFLGDYLDRGRYGFEGVLRLALHLFTAFPEHVHLLRGNHEMFVEHEGAIVSAVVPAEAFARLRPHAPRELFHHYGVLFDSLPGSLLCGRVLLTHGGVPRDALAREAVHGLSGLNDWTVRFQMMWSDPSVADVIPRALQESTYRFGFGRLQCQGFLERLGCHTLIRGHEHLAEGFRLSYEDDRVLLATVIAAGGADNRDLPEEADLRLARPMALTLATNGEPDGTTRIDAWPLDYARYNSPETNGFYRSEPSIPF